MVSDIDLNPAATHNVALNLRCARYVAEARPHLAFSVGGHVEKIKVAELEVTVTEDWPPGADDALLRLARAAKEYRDALHRIADAIKAGRGAEYLVDAEDCGRVCDDALSAFDFTD